MSLSSTAISHRAIGRPAFRAQSLSAPLPTPCVSVSIGAGRGITRQLVTELIKTSYRSVVETMSAHGRPKGP